MLYFSPWDQAVDVEIILLKPEAQTKPSNERVILIRKLFACWHIGRVIVQLSKLLKTLIEASPRHLLDLTSSLSPDSTD